MTIDYKQLLEDALLEHEDRDICFWSSDLPKTKTVSLSLSGCGVGSGYFVCTYVRNVGSFSHGPFFDLDSALIELEQEIARMELT